MGRITDMLQMVRNIPRKAERGIPLLSVFFVGAIYFSLLFSLKELAGTSPFITVGLSWIWFLIPGWLLSYVININITWWARIPLSFVLAIGLATPVTMVAILLRLNLETFIRMHISLLVLSGTLLIVTQYRRYRISSLQSIPKENSNKEDIVDKLDKVNILLFAILFVCAGVLTLLALMWPISGDEIAGLPLFADVLNQNQISGTEPFHGSGIPVTPRNELIVLT